MSDDVAAKRSKRAAVYDMAAMTVTLHGEGEPLVLNALALGNDAARWAQLHGIAQHCMRSEDAQVAFGELVAGNVPEPRRTASKELDSWRMAYAHALVQETKKSPSPLTLDDAKELAGRLAREGLTKIKQNPVVVQMHHKHSARRRHRLCCPWWLRNPHHSPKRRNESMAVSSASLNGLAGASLHGAGRSPCAWGVIRAHLDSSSLKTCAGPEFNELGAGVFSERLLMERANVPSVEARYRAPTRVVIAANFNNASLLNRR